MIVIKLKRFNEAQRNFTLICVKLANSISRRGEANA